MFSPLFSSFMMSGENDYNVLLLLHNYLYTHYKNGDTNQETVNDRNPIHLTQSCIKAKSRKYTLLYLLTKLAVVYHFPDLQLLSIFACLPCRQHFFNIPASLLPLCLPLFSFSWTSIISFQLHHTGNS